MRTLPEEANFTEFLLDVGDGVLNYDDNLISRIQILWTPFMEI